MATGDQFDFVRPGEMTRESGPPQEPVKIPAGAVGSPPTGTGIVSVEGVPLFKQDTQGYQFVTRIWTNGTPLTTGLTFGLYTSDDINNSSPGLVVRIGMTIKKLTSGTSDWSLASAGAEQFTTITTNATAGVGTLTSFAIANANLNSAGAGDLIIVRIRRNGSNAADTHKGTLLLVGVSIRDT